MAAIEGGDGKVRLDIDGAVAIITNDNPSKHNAFDDAMDVQLFDILGELRGRPEVRAIIWRGEGKSFSSGRDVGSIGTDKAGIPHHDLMQRGHRGILQLFDLPAPVIVAFHGWAMGGSFQRALLCDIRVAADDSRFRLPELTHGVIPDTGGVVRLFQICGPGVVSDMVLTGRIMNAAEALSHGIVSRVVPADSLDDTVREMADHIAGLPPLAVSTARRVIRHLGDAAVRASLEDELIAQTFLHRSDDTAELRRARAEGRPPVFKRS